MKCVMDGGRDLRRNEAVSLSIDEEEAGGVLQSLQVLGAALALEAASVSISKFCLHSVFGVGPEPVNKVIGVAAAWRSVGLGREQVFGQAQCFADSSVEVVTLVKVDVFKKVASHGLGRMTLTIDVDTGEMRDCTFDGREPVAQIFGNVG